jgi:tRNA(Arg) A34 adenosine deaminase TadA
VARLAESPLVPVAGRLNRAAHESLRGTGYYLIAEETLVRGANPQDRRHSPGQSTDSYVATALAAAEPYSDAEYFAMLLVAAMQAQETGDYGIAAALVIRDQNTELISFGRNAVLSSRDPLGHAEINAIRGIQSVLANQRAGRVQHVPPWTGQVQLSSAAGAVFSRPAQPGLSSDAIESVLYTSLEPCPMCTVAIISSRIGRVIIAAQDEQGGALAPERFARLPPAWASLASEQGLSVGYASPESSVAPIPAQLAARLARAFRATKEARDAEVSQGVLLHDDIPAAIAELVARGKPG